jgi:hypothetical protein
MMNDTYDDKDDTAYTETMNHGKSSQKKGESSRDKKRSGSDAQRKSGGRDRGGSKSGKNSTQKRMVPATSADVSPARVHQTKKKKAVSLLHPFAQAAKAGPSSPNRFAPLQSDTDEDASSPLEHGQLDATTPMTPNYAHNEPSFTTGSLGPGPRQGRKTSAVDDLAHTPTAQTL